MFGLPGQTIEQWKFTLEKTISLQPEHISAYCLTYEEDTEFFLRHSRGELLQNTDTDAAFFEMTMSILKMPAMTNMKFLITRDLAFHQPTIAPIGWEKIISASVQARFRLSV